MVSVCDQLITWSLHVCVFGFSLGLLWGFGFGFGFGIGFRFRFRFVFVFVIVFRLFDLILVLGLLM